MAGHDDPIKENPQPGVTFKSVTMKQVNELVEQTAGGRPLTMADLQGWGPQATRIFSQTYFAKVRDDYKNGHQLIIDIAEGRVPPDKVAGEAEKKINSGRVRDTILKAGLEEGSPIADRGRAMAAIAGDLEAIGANVSKLSQDRMAAANAPPILTQVAAQNFPPAPAGGAPFADISNGDYKYASVTPADATRAAQDLLAGRREQVAETIKTWGAKSLDAMLNDYRNRLWPEDLNKAKQALAAAGTDDYAESLKAIQSPELKALVEKENAALAAGKSQREVNYDFEALQKGIFGRGVEVQSNALIEVQAREGRFWQQKQQQEQKGASVAPADQPVKPAPPGSDIDKASLAFARENPRNWPDLKGWGGENLDVLRVSAQTHMREDGQQAANIARFLHDGGDPRKIDEIQNPAMKKIVEADMKEGKTVDQIVADLQQEVDSRNHFVNQKIDMSYSSIPQASQPKVASNGSARP